MTAKQAILQSVHQGKPEEVSLPSAGGLGTIYDDPVAQYCEMLEKVAGNAIRVTDQEALTGALTKLEVYQSAHRVYSALPDICPSTVQLDEVADPRELDQLDLAVLPAEFAVAENGAAWVTDRGLRHRVIYVIAEHLVLVVDAASVVHHMHQAYDRLKFSDPGYGLFIAGPSKTADIELSLVIGAQGPRSLHVFVIGSCPETSGSTSSRCTS